MSIESMTEYEFMSIDRMTEYEVSDVASMEREIFADGWSETTIRNTMMLEHTEILVAKREREVAGYIILYYSGEVADVARIAVREEFRRGGVADELLFYAEAIGSERGIERVLLEVRASNSSAIALYKKHGFKEIGKRKSYYTEPVEDGIVMEKEQVISTSYSTENEI